MSLSVWQMYSDTALVEKEVGVQATSNLPNFLEATVSDSNIS
jgi:hypothetical protein